MSYFTGYNTQKNVLLIDSVIQDTLASQDAYLGTASKPFRRVFSNTLTNQNGDLLVNKVQSSIANSPIQVNTQNGIVELVLDSRLKPINANAPLSFSDNGDGTENLNLNVDNSNLAISQGLLALNL